MARFIVMCPICQSEKLHGRICQSCLDMNDEEWALKEAKEDYANDVIDIKELERRIEIALTDPPIHQNDPVVYS